VNIVVNGATRTPLLRGFSDSQLRAISPLWQILEAEDVAEAAVYLLAASRATEAMHKW